MPTKRKSANARTTSRKKRSTKKKSWKKSFKAKALSKFPKTESKTTSYESTLSGSNIVQATPVLTIQFLNNLGLGLGVDQRIGSKIFLKGFRYRAHYQNRLFRPVVVNVAIVLPLQGQDTGSYGTGMLKRFGLFSEGASNTDMDFGGTGMNGIHYATLPINSEKYNVIWHTRFKLGVTSTSAGYSSGELKNYRSLYRYFRINKPIEYPDNSSTIPAPSMKFLMLTWAVPMDYQQEQGSIDDALQMQQHCVCVYQKYVT